eukprot:TRINITY_DN219_c0_g1_i1.p1 TRINITY_DN219_c0_g1~~TRINITY_DN219_c0_g1_i1.p1  ORF type:complete len:247 (-),score=93.80 TRINITY_DN219_c0_g1_i1:1284-2024(-)
MVSIRRANVDDMIAIQNANLTCLPENYQMKYYFYHMTSWPQLTFLAENDKGEVVGYVLGKMEEEAAIPHGHITSIAVLRSYRKLGVATKLLRQSHQCMQDSFGAHYVSLHVRRGNRAALSLYRDTLGYKVYGVEARYYADGEDAFAMRCNFVPEEPETPAKPAPHQLPPNALPRAAPDSAVARLRKRHEEKLRRQEKEKEEKSEATSAEQPKETHAPEEKPKEAQQPSQPQHKKGGNKKKGGKKGK